MLCVHLKYNGLVGLFLLALTLAPASLFANPFDIATSISIDSIEGNGVDLRDIVLSFDSLFKKNSSYQVKIGSALLPDDKGHIKNIILHCHEGIISKQIVECSDGQLSFEDQLASAKQAKIQFSRSKAGDLSFSMDDFNLADGSASLNAEMKDGAWQVWLKSNNISFAKLQAVLPSFPSNLSKGVVSSDITFVGKGSLLQEIHGEAFVNQFSFSNEDSTAVGEEVATKIKFASKNVESVWQSKINATAFQGELYFDPVFMDANESPKDLYGVINWTMSSNQIELAPLHFEDSNALHVRVETVIDYEQKKAITPIQATIEYALFPNAYENYLQPFLLDSNIADLNSKGAFSGSILLDGSRIVETDLKLDYLTLSDKQDRFSITNLNGNFGWGSRYSGKEYEFNFEAANIYKLRLEASRFAFSNNEQALVLKKPVSVPLLDGAINIESFQIQQPGKQDQAIVMDISLTPVSMSKLSTTFGWPEMHGNLAGYAPNVTYKKGDVDIQGALLIRGFGGSTTIHNLSASDLFSITPKVTADVKFNNLDLSSLTETFSFGEITGRLEGSINNLQFVNWAPVEFDAWFGTPDKDKSRHRISQTAVDNLTQVGNGGSNILSKSFLKFFDSFGYDKLGLGCTLKNNTCIMRGVNDSAATAAQNFYIVKGSGVPRIDIVGFTKQVSWTVLIARLQRVVKKQEIIVK